ncbi:hypothetical protein NQZ79_g5858 [Umbelopsis isabellina]|nr:hypothetical protein NQZ79_g5858 [Umbelopsis isabellina]
MHQLLNETISFLERVTEPAEWNLLLGPRIFGLASRYVTNDVVVAGFMFYVYSLFQTAFNRIYEDASYFIQSFLYASIRIEHGDPLFVCVHEFLSEKTAELPRLRVAVARAHWESEDDDAGAEAGERPSVALSPPLGSVNFIDYNGRRLQITRQKLSEGTTNPDEPFKAFLPQIEIIEIRIRFGTVNTLRQILEEWKDLYYRKKYGKVSRSRFLGENNAIQEPIQTWGHWEWDSSLVKVPRRFDTVVMKEGQKEDLLQDIKTFLNKNAWYEKRGIPYRRGYLLHGPPGTGKTSTIEAIAGELHMNVSIISLSNDMEDSRFMASLQTKPRNSILLIEDIDSVRISSNDDSKNSSRGGYYEKGLTLSSVLNALDGIVGQQGSVVFLTCNDTTKLPPALLRPGRIDKKLHLGLADEYQIRSMFERFFEICNDKTLEKLIELLPKDELAPAELQNFFMMYSLQDDLKHICDGVPAFLEGVRKDREQARLHAERTKQKRDIYGNLANPGAAPPTPSTDDEEKEEQEVDKENTNRRIIIDVKDDGQLCMASS